MANVASLFRRLLPETPEVIVTVQTIHSDGTSTVTTISGGSMRIVGTSVAEGSKAYVQNGRIQDQAPDLPYYELETP